MSLSNTAAITLVLIGKMIPWVILFVYLERNRSHRK